MKSVTLHFASLDELKDFVVITAPLHYTVNEEESTLTAELTDIAIEIAVNVYQAALVQ